MGNAVTEPGQDIPGGCAFEVLVSAGSSRSRVQSLHGDALKVAVRAAPEKGKANSEVVEVLAAFLQLPVRQVTLVAGHTARRKRVQALGLSVASFRAKVRAAGL